MWCAELRATRNHKTGGKQLMKIKAVIAVTALIASTGITMAQTSTETRRTFGERFSYDRESGDRFHGNEFTVDVFGSYHRGSANVDDFFDNTDNDRWGGGLGFNYFFTPFLGLGVDSAVHDNRGSFVDFVNASLIARFPVEDAGIAPYVFGGGGRMFDPTDAWSVHAGVGFEFRLNPTTGIFIDGRYAWGEDSTDYSLIRSGLRFSF